MISMIINQVFPINLEVTSEIMYLHPTSTIPIFTQYYGILCQVWESTYISNIDNDLKYRSKYHLNAPTHTIPYVVVLQTIRI